MLDILCEIYIYIYEGSCALPCGLPRGPLPGSLRREGGQLRLEAKGYVRKETVYERSSNLRGRDRLFLLRKLKVSSTLRRRAARRKRVFELRGAATR